MGPTSFEFVTQEGPPRGFSRGTKARIRRQAMKAVAAARRQTARYGRHNLRQHTISYAKAESELKPTAVQIGGRQCDQRIEGHNKKRSKDGTRRGSQCPKEEVEVAGPTADETAVAAARSKPPPSLLYSCLELFMSEFSIEPADLSALTSIHVAPLARGVLATQPGKLRDLLSSRQWSYFEHLYSRFGNSACLDDALSCLIMVAQDLMAPSSRTSRRRILAQHHRALKSLQNALSNPRVWIDPDTLCATSMLQLFSVLYPAACSPETWSQHLLGSMRLMELKGPHGFKTDYEKALLRAVAGSITAENFYQNRVSFLEEPEWQEAILACKLQTDLFSDRSPLAIDLAVIMVKLPGACKRVGDVVCGGNPSAEAIARVREEVRRLRRELRLWRDRFDTELVVVDLPSPSVPASQKYKRLDALANAIIFEVILARLLGSLQASERPLMEDEIRQRGAYFARMEEACAARDYRTAFYMSQKRCIAAALTETSHLWRAPCCRSGDELIEAWKFRAWCDAVPRRAPALAP